MQTLTSIACRVPDRRFCDGQHANATRQSKRTADHSCDSVEISGKGVHLSGRGRVPTESMVRLLELQAAVSENGYVTKAKIEWVANRLLDEFEA